MKKFLVFLLSILVLFSSVVLTAYAEDNAPAGTNPATNDEAQAFNVETYDYKSLINSTGNPRLNEGEVKTAKFITIISENEKSIFALVYATNYPVLTGIEYTEIGDYVFASAISKPDTLGLYVVWFSKYKIVKPAAERNGWYLSYVDTLKNAGENGFVNMREVYHAIEKAQKEKGYLGFIVEHKDGELGEKCAAAIEKSYGCNDYQEILGKVSDCYLVYGCNKVVSHKVYQEELGPYIFSVSDHISEYPLGLYLVKEDTAYSLKDAYDKKVISDSDLDEIAKMDLKKYCEIIKVEKSTPDEASLKSDIVFGENDEYKPLYKASKTTYVKQKSKKTTPKTAYVKQKSKKTTPKNTYIKLKSKKIKNFELDLFKKLKDGIYIAHQKGAAVSMCSYGINIDKYTYWITDKPSAVYIFDYRNYKEYALDTAFEKGIITKKHLSKISKMLDELHKKTHYCPTLYETEEYVSAGEQTSPYRFGLSSMKKMTISNKKVVKFVSKNKGYVFVGLKKGTATVKLTPKKGKPIYEKITVKSNPKLTNKEGKKIKTISVKHGKAVKIFIKGKAKGVNNKYKNTKYAKVISKKSAAKITIKGCKRGKSTLKIVVNKMTLKLKVKVK